AAAAKGAIMLVHQTQKKNPLLASITAFCRAHDMAESTFGRRAVNDGKFVARLRDGARVTPETWERVTAFIARHGGKVPAARDPAAMHVVDTAGSRAATASAIAAPVHASSRKNFRFFDNRQKYLLFVNTCSEK